MRLSLLFLFSALFFFSCKEEKSSNKSQALHPIAKESIKYAQGFSITHYKNYSEILVTSAYPKSQDTCRYLLINKGQDIPPRQDTDIVIKLPIKRLVVMSTTNIPTLEYLDVHDKLIGFPSTRLISSRKTRTRIEKGEITDLNNELQLNMELLLDLNPDLVIGFTVNGNNKTIDQIEKFNIPVVLDGSWTEAHPLGRAEWIKFTSAFFNKKKEADSIFKTIEKNYLEAKKLALKVKNKPVVFSGSMFNDVWNIPGGKSFIAKYLEDANTNYLWKDNMSNGSLQLNFENVLEKAQKAKLWIGAGAFQNKAEMKNQHKGYSYFDAFQNNNIYTYTNKIGTKGGILYYELGPLRPDIILKDIINISHPDLLKNYNNFFFKRLE